MFGHRSAQLQRKVSEMREIRTLPELSENLSTLERYMNSSDDEEREYHRDRVRKGICFVAYQKGGRYLFAPSRFIGYWHNTMTLHEDNEDKHGSDTNRAIDQLLGPHAEDSEMECQYEEFCTELGFPARSMDKYPYKRKYWRFPKAASRM
jgi:hypothetical protein